jgi:phosphoglycolate phosphatase-like HAD superfamily hydrolase
VFVRSTVILFDIDGTLVRCGGAGRAALRAALSDLYGPTGDVFPSDFGGRTDRALVRAALTGLCIERDAAGMERAIDAVIERYLKRLDETLRAASSYTVLPGVGDLLGWLGGRAELAVGLGTGNVRRGAYAKLARGGLGDAFSFGGFGCDAEDRAALLAVGAERGASELGAERASCRIIVVGDTPRDVAAARQIGAECVAVATGGCSREELGGAGASHVFTNLAEPGVYDVLSA